MKQSGCCSFRVDLQDHLGGGLNNLRFADELWESGFSSGFYTNRIRYSVVLEIFAGAGFAVSVLDLDRWQRLPISRNRIQPRSAALTDEDLSVSAFDVVLEPV